MEALKNWAKGVYLLAVFSSVVMMIIPKRVEKQSRFVMELLMLLCIMAPVTGFVKNPIDRDRVAWNLQENDFGYDSLREFYEVESCRRVKELAEDLGLSVESVSVEVSGHTPNFSVGSITLRLSDLPHEEIASGLKDFLSAYFSINQDQICLEQFPDK